MEIFELHPNLITIPDRQRQEMDESKLDKLTDSIDRLGQLQPIYITRDHVLVYGGRRQRACKRLDIKVKCAYVDEVDPITLQEMELEENLQREDLPWADVVAATDKIHKLKELKYGKSYPGSRQDNWTQAKTADLLGVSTSEVGNRLQLAEAIQKDPTIAKAKTEHDALKLVMRAKESLILKELARRAEAKRATLNTDLQINLIKGSCLDETTGISSLHDHSVGCFCMDPPYGIDLHDTKYKSPSTHDSYIDIPREEFLQFMTHTLKQCFPKANYHSYIYLWCGYEHYNSLTRILQDIGWEVWGCPFIYYHQGIPGQTNQPSHWPANVCELAIFGRKGNPSLTKEGLHNHLAYTIDPRVKIHPTEKPIDLSIDLLSRVQYPDMLVCDPFAGSGSTLLAAHKLKLPSIGWELDESFYNSAIHRIMKEVSSEQPTTG